MSSNNEETRRVFSFSPTDNKVYSYQMTEEKLQEAADTFMLDIFFELTDEEYAAFGMRDNLKEDFVYFNPKINGMSQMVCTCGKFDEWSNNHNKLAKLAVKHARRTGHTLNPRGN